MIGELPTMRTRMEVLKVRIGAERIVCVISKKPLTFHVHWLDGRSYMCPGPDCQACFAGIGARWHGLLGVKWAVPGHATPRGGILEVTATAYDRLDGLRRMFDLGSLYGLRCSLMRPTQKSGLRIEPLDPEDEGPVAKKPLPEWFLVDAAATLYGLPCCPDASFVEKWEATAMPRAAVLIRTALREAVRS